MLVYQRVSFFFLVAIANPYGIRYDGSEIMHGRLEIMKF